MNDNLNGFERAVLHKLLAGSGAKLAALRRQLEQCRVRKREETGAGVYTYLDVDRTCEPVRLTKDPARIGGVDAELPSLSHGVGFVLLLRDGYLEMLEAYTYDEPWPESLAGFNLRYAPAQRDLSALVD